MVVDYYFREGFAAKHKINFLTIIFKVLLCEMLNFYLKKKNHKFKAAFKQDQKTESLRTNGFWGEAPAKIFPCVKY